LEKVKLLGESCAAGPTPVPVSVTLCGLLLALSLMLSAPLMLPGACGLNVTLNVQLAPAFSELPQLLVCWKFLSIVTVRMFSVAVPVLESVTLFAALLDPTA
jgi:hypothetical protein